MRKLLFLIAVAAVVVLGGREVATAQENGTLPPRVWLPIVGNIDVASRCGISEGRYYIHRNREGLALSHAVGYQIEEYELIDHMVISVARDPLFQDVVREGGNLGLVPDYIKVLLEPDALITGRTYYAKMAFSCDGIFAQTPVLSFVAQKPE